jgi:excisionase family DNA binding protein
MLTLLERKVLTVKEVAEYLRVNPSTIYRLLHRHELHAFKIGGDWRFNIEEIDRWLANLQRRTADYGLSALVGNVAHKRLIRHL